MEITENSLIGIANFLASEQRKIKDTQTEKANEVALTHFQKNPDID